jgi:hypothetical protein
MSMDTAALEAPEAATSAAGTGASRPAPLTVVNVWHMGGAINAVGPDESAFVERSAPYLVSVDGNWSHASQDRDGIDWVRSA